MTLWIEFQKPIKPIITDYLNRFVNINVDEPDVINSR
jgi:hypothetical protein